MRIPRHLAAFFLPACWAAGFLLPSPCQAVCLCGNGDGAPTLVAPLNPAVNLSMDGVVSDWTPVIADEDNGACDGPEDGRVDRDAPVQSTGRDLVQFVYTWNGEKVYFYSRRTGSATNIQRFLYYADLDLDGKMENSDRMIGVEWQGNTRLVSVYTGNYVAVGATGDRVVDAMGYGDGYTLPGTVANMTLRRSGNWGSTGGLEMEFSITWNELGLAPGDPHGYHVASLNSVFTSAPGQVDDNMGGCGGGAGTSEFAAATFAPSRANSAVRGQTVVSPHLLINTGNIADTYDLTVSFTGTCTPTYALYRDLNRNGTLDAGDAPATHTSLLAAAVLGANGGSFPLLVAYAIPPVGTGSVTATVTATSRFAMGVVRTVDDTLTIKSAVALTVLKSATLVSDPINGNFQPKSIPGALLNYTVQVTNYGDRGADTDSTWVTDAVPSGTWLYLGELAGPGNGPVIFNGSAIDPSGLTYSFVALDSDADGLDFHGPSGWGYHPNPVGGYDPAVTQFRIMLGGAFASSDGVTQPSFTLRFRVMVK